MIDLTKLLYLNVGLWVLTVVSAGAAAYLGSYLKKKGENAATKEDFAELKKQVAETTEATKAIEARVTDEYWNKQRHWEMKRDLLTNALETLMKRDDALMGVGIHKAIEHRGFMLNQSQRDTLQSAVTSWHDADRVWSLQHATAIIICQRKTVDVMNEYWKLMTNVWGKLSQDGTAHDRGSRRAVTFGMVKVLNAIRAELGVPDPAADEQKKTPSA